MKNMRNLTMYFLALVAAAFAAPSQAQKLYDAAITSGGGVGLSATAVLRFTNAQPNGNSNFNSLQGALEGLPDGVAITGIQASSGVPRFTPNGFDVQNMYPVKPRQFATVTLTLSGIECGKSASFTLYSQVYAGSSLSGEQFVDVNGPGTTDDNRSPANISSNCDGTLACWTDPDAPPPPTSSSYFKGSDPADASIVDSGFFEGYRARNWKGADCPPVPFKIYNNVGGSISILDAFNTTVPPNFTVINYASSNTNGVLIAHTVTFAVEPSDANGLPDANRKTYYCVPGTDCVGANRKLAQGCTSPAISEASVPGVEPGCIRGANWVIIPAMDPKCVAVNGIAQAPSCIQWAVDFLEKGDPPWGRS